MRTYYIITDGKQKEVEDIHISICGLGVTWKADTTDCKSIHSLSIFATVQQAWNDITHRLESRQTSPLTSNNKEV